ncbi:Carnitine O-acetyltransferase mitochondrial [Dipsacomyces acuminosporus]|nr:Carnitine O-acetyltransferase mitochondrial [Dipsacomyces acuminosporus]
MSASTRNQESEHGRLFQHQSQLPKLPVPDLSSTLAKYIESLEPVLPKDKFEQSKQIAEEFAQSAEGKELQRRLEARAAEPGRPNWLEEWWNELSYMGYRDPVIPYVSYHYSYNDDPACVRPNQRAAKIICGAMAFRQLIVDGSLEPEMQKTAPLCSHSYKFMFNACRIPKRPSDYCRTVEYAGNDYITVMRNNQFFSLPLVHAGVPLTLDEIEAALDRIVEEADSTVAAPVGILTADNRDSWSDNRDLLLQSPENAAVLNEIESSAFLVSLEKDRPVTREEFSHATWHGNGRNRWFDKPCQFAVFDNARAGFCGEHSMMDGTPTLRLSEFVMSFKPQPQHLSNGAVPRRENTPIRQLRFRTPPAVIKAVRKAGEFFDTGIAKQHLAVLNYRAYGKEQVKRFKCSPDAFVQMIIQLAYSRLHKCVRPTYESSMTRKYLHGRTETCRSVSSESAAWCKAMADPNAGNEERIRLFRSALAKHTKLTREAVDGKGVDRHLLGLRLLVRPGEQKPKIFEDPAYAYSSHWFLSTSQISSDHYTSYGWSEVTPKGYGVAYNIRKEDFIIHITCMRNEHGLDSDYFAAHLEKALDDVRDMLSLQQ